MNIYDHVFSSSQVAKASEMTSANFRAQFTRNHWRIIGKERPGNGEGHLFTIYDAMAYALARRLMDYGFEASRAFDLAVMDFAHGSVGDRDPGGVFDPVKYGRTFFIASMHGAQGQCLAEKSVKNPIEFLFPPMCGLQKDAVIIDLNQLQNQVFEALGVKGRKLENKA